jgi:EAL domain-containing protein (putative c-di-GMP-specific phosphodiesterase class I)
MKEANNYQLFLLDKEKTYQEPMPFFMQPIVGARDGLIFGFEILFRGGVPPEWTAIDKSVVTHLYDAPADTLPIFFVNLCHQAFLEIPHQRFIEASCRNKIYFEINPGPADASSIPAVTEKIEALSANGVLFANDDFGRDGNVAQPLLAADCLSAVKVDGTLLQAAMADAGIANTLRELVAGWREAGMLAIAERIETAAMLDFAREMAIDYAQGFHIDAMLNGLDSQDLSSVA